MSRWKPFTRPAITQITEYEARYGVSHTPPSPFGEQLRALRKARGWTQAELSIRCGVASSHISNWETGRLQWAAPHNLVRLADALGVPVDEMLRTPPQNVPNLRMLAPGKPVETPHRTLRRNVPTPEPLTP